MVKDEEVVGDSKAQIQDGSAEVGQHQQAEDLPQGPVLGPRRRVHIRGQDVRVGNIQHQIHGSNLWRERERGTNYERGCQQHCISQKPRRLLSFLVRIL